MERVRKYGSYGEEYFRHETVVMGETQYKGQDAWMLDGRILWLGASPDNDPEMEQEVGIYYQADSVQSRVSTLAYTSEFVVRPPYPPTGVTSEDFAPPYLTRYDLDSGQSHTQVTVTTVEYPGGSINRDVPRRSTVSYAGRETITVSVGTFETCRFDETVIDDNDGTPIETSTSWVHVGTGIRIRAIEQKPNEDGPANTELMGATIDGSPIQ